MNQIDWYEDSFYVTTGQRQKGKRKFEGRSKENVVNYLSSLGLHLVNNPLHAQWAVVPSGVINPGKHINLPIIPYDEVLNFIHSPAFRAAQSLTVKNPRFQQKKEWQRFLPWSEKEEEALNWDVQLNYLEEELKGQTDQDRAAWHQTLPSLVKKPHAPLVPRNPAPLVQRQKPPEKRYVTHQIQQEDVLWDTIRLSDWITLVNQVLQGVSISLYNYELQESVLQQYFRLMKELLDLTAEVRANIVLAWGDLPPPFIPQQSPTNQAPWIDVEHWLKSAHQDLVQQFDPEKWQLLHQPQLLADLDAKEREQLTPFFLHVETDLAFLYFGVDQALRRMKLTFTQQIQQIREQYGLLLEGKLPTDTCGPPLFVSVENTCQAVPFLFQMESLLVAFCRTDTIPLKPVDQKSLHQLHRLFNTLYKQWFPHDPLPTTGTLCNDIQTLYVHIITQVKRDVHVPPEQVIFWADLPQLYRIESIHWDDLWSQLPEKRQPIQKVLEEMLQGTPYADRVKTLLTTLRQFYRVQKSLVTKK